MKFFFSEAISPSKKRFKRPYFKSVILLFIGIDDNIEYTIK